MKRKTLSRHQSPRAFTLIELLVVIAIIALLVSILMPSLKKAKELARRAVCSSNQHSIVLAANMYAADFNGQVRMGGFDWWPNWIQHSVAPTRVNLSAYYPEYITSGEVFGCPSDLASGSPEAENLDRFAEIWDDFGDFPSSGWFGGGANPTEMLVSSFTMRAYEYNIFPVIRWPNRDISELGSKAFLVDFFYNGNSPGGEPRLVHDDGWNVAYMDGSVRFVSQDDFEDNFIDRGYPGIPWKYTYNALWCEGGAGVGQTWRGFDDF